MRELIQNPDKNVLVVEGEKAYEAAKIDFLEYVVVTWAGGANRIHNSDWSVVEGRHLILCPDADAAGLATVEALRSEASRANAASLHYVRYDNRFPKGWDLYDPAPNGVDKKRLINSATPVDLSAGRAFLSSTYHELSERVFYVVAEEKFFDPTTGLLMSAPQFDAAFRHLKEAKRGRLSQRFLKDFPGRKIDEFRFVPGLPDKVSRDETGVIFFNIWRPSSIDPVVGDASIFTDHLHLIAGTNEQFEFLADLLAYIVQNPGKKLMFAALIYGVHGTGKSYIGDVMSELVGRHNATMLVTSELKSSFNEYLINKLLLVVEELMALGRKEITNTLKPIITQPKLPRLEKHKRRGEIDNYVNLILFSNHEDALYIENTERRFFVIDSPAPRQPAEYFERLWSWTAGNYGVILNWFLSRDLGHFSPMVPPPETEGLRRVKEAGLSDVAIDMQGRIEHHETPFVFDIVEAETILNHYYREMGAGKNEVFKALKECGGDRKGQHKIIVDGEPIKRSLWIMRNHDQWNSVSPSKRLRAFENFHNGLTEVTDDNLPF